MLEERHLPPFLTGSETVAEEVDWAPSPMTFLGDQDSFLWVLFLGFPSFPVSLLHFFLESFPNSP